MIWPAALAIVGATALAPASPAKGLLPEHEGGSGARSSVEIEAKGDAGRVADSAGRSSVSGGGLLVLHYYTHPVEDDATPIALQPYLQRRSRVSLVLGGSGNTGGPERVVPLPALGAGHTLVGGAAFDGYLSRSIALTGEVGFRLADSDRAPNALGQGAAIAAPQRSSFGLRAAFGLGVRIYDLRLDAQLSMSPERLDGRWVAAPALGGVFIVRAVLLEHLDVGARVQTLPGGASCDTHIDWYVGRRLGLLAGIGGARGQLRGDDLAVSETIGVRIGARFDVSRRFGVSLLYEPRWSSGPDGPPGPMGPGGNDKTTALDHRVSLTLRSRLPW